MYFKLSSVSSKAGTRSFFLFYSTRVQIGTKSSMCLFFLKRGTTRVSFRSGFIFITDVPFSLLLSVCTLMLLATKKCGQKQIVGDFYSMHRSYLISTHPCSWYAASVGTHTQNLSGPVESISADSCKMHRMTRRDFPLMQRGCERRHPQEAQVINTAILERNGL